MNTSLKFFINKAKENKKLERSSICLRIVQNKSKAEGKLSLVPVHKEDYKFWNIKTQRFDSKQKRFNSYNLMLNALENEFHNYLRENRHDLASIRPKAIRDHLLDRNDGDKNLNLIESIKSYYVNDILPDRDKAKGTKKNYNKSINHFSNFITKSNLFHLTPEEFKRQHAHKFLDYLKKPDNKTGKIALKGQSINAIVKNIKPYFNKLQLEERIISNPFEGVRAIEKKSIKPRLSNEDFLRIIELNLGNDIKLEAYRDIFLFLCFTGLSYCDAIDLTSSDVKNGYIELCRRKSKIRVKQYLTKQAKSIIQKYEGEQPENRILPKRSLDKLNLNLKIMVLMAGIDYNVSSYSARRFFRQSIYEAGIRESLVVKTLMGHTTTKDMDSHYLYVNDSILKDARKKLNKHFKKLML